MQDLGTPMFPVSFKGVNGGKEWQSRRWEMREGKQTRIDS